jgi:hypothetical protein
MNTDKERQQFTKEQIRECPKAEQPSLTIQSTPLAEPQVTVVAPVAVDPKTTEQQRRAEHHDEIWRKHQQETESPMTLSGLTEKERCREKKWLKEERKRLRGKRQA